jgi:uncharacterized DUF497 family protein
MPDAATKPCNPKLLLLQKPVEFTFDPEKDAANQLKHGISLRNAERMDLNTARFASDERYDYGEARTQALGTIDGRLHMLVFTMRGPVMRIISLRKANLKEVKRYEQTS